LARRIALVAGLVGWLCRLACAAAGAPAQPTQSWIYSDRPYRVAVEVRVTSPRTPVVVPFDPAAALTQRGSASPFDPESIAVGSSRGPVPAQISEGLETGNSGTVSWLVSEPGRQTFHIYFDLVRSPGRHRTGVPAREPIGAGDAFFHNRPDGFDRLGVGMMNDQPLAVDWDGDGTTDLLQRNLYSTTYGEPWWGIYFWRNIGTDAAPRFDRYLRLRADGRWIEEKYGSYQLVDWNRDGRLDLLCGVGSGEDRGRLKVYVNTGQRDARGLPILKVGPVLPLDGGGPLTYGMRLFDWSGRGTIDLFTLLLRVEYFPTQLVELTLYRHPNRAGPNEVPRFGAAEVVPLGGKNVQDAWPSDLMDIDGDGKPDLIGCTRDRGAKPPRTCVVAWKNTGAADRPEFTSPPACIFDTSPQDYAVPTWAAPWRSLLVDYLGAWLRRLEPTAAGLVDRGLLEARGLPCAFGGYSSVDVVDWEGDGDLDFVGGNETGSVQLIENVSTAGRTMFRTARPIPLQGGGTMLAARWQFIDDLDPERSLGQSKPMVVDWDGDGDLDILAGNNSNRIAYFENRGTRRRPLYAPARKLVHDGGEHFSFRAHPSAVDWNGDGLPDLVAGSSRGRDRNDGPDIATCLYLRYRAPGGELRLRAGEPVRLEDGSELRTPIPYHHGFEAADWDGDGDLDLFTNEKSHVVFYRNIGNNARPVFRREPVRAFGVPLMVSHHETSVKVVDWDHDGRLDLVTGGESGWVYYFNRSVLETPTHPVAELGSLEERPRHALVPRRSVR
jgi:hypothetical protein